MFCRFYRYQHRRRCLYKKAPIGPVKDYLAEPFPDRNALIDDVELLALDFETTGLHPRTDKILSVGSVNVTKNEIDISSAYQEVLQIDKALTEQNVSVHHITDDERVSGVDEGEVIADLLYAMQGKVLLVHYAPIERRFLQAACKKLYGIVPFFPMIDTLELARKRFVRKGLVYSPGDLKLYALRNNYALPHYKAHNSLNDALSTAELFLADLEHADDSCRQLKYFLS